MFSCVDNEQDFPVQIDGYVMPYWNDGGIRKIKIVVVIYGPKVPAYLLHLTSIITGVLAFARVVQVDYNPILDFRFGYLVLLYMGYEKRGSFRLNRPHFFCIYPIAFENCEVKKLEVLLISVELRKWQFFNPFQMEELLWTPF